MDVHAASFLYTLAYALNAESYKFSLSSRTPDQPLAFPLISRPSSLVYVAPTM